MTSPFHPRTADPFYPISVQIHPLDSNFLAALDYRYQQIAVSRNKGANWTVLPAPGGSVIELDPVDIGTIYLGLLRSTDFGHSWTQIGPASAAGVSFLKIFPKNHSILYLVDGHFNIYRSVNAGKSWTKRGALPNSSGTGVLEDFEDFAIDPKNPAILYGPGFGGMHKSIDGGKTWVKMNRGLSDSAAFALTFVSISRFDSHLLFCGNRTSQAFVSRDGGATWAELDLTGIEDPVINDVIVDAQNPSQLWAATDHGVYTSAVP